MKASFEKLDGKGYIRQFCFLPTILWYQYDSTGYWTVICVWLKWKISIYPKTKYNT